MALFEPVGPSKLSSSQCFVLFKPVPDFDSLSAGFDPNNPVPLDGVSVGFDPKSPDPLLVSAGFEPKRPPDDVVFEGVDPNKPVDPVEAGFSELDPKRPVPLDGAVAGFSAGFDPKRLTGSVVAGFDPNKPPAGLSDLTSAGFDPNRLTGGTSDFGAVDGFDPKRLTAGLGASELGFEPNKPPPDGASSFFLSSVEVDSLGFDPLEADFDPNKPPDPNPGFGNPGFSFSVSTAGALKLIPPPDGFRSFSSSGGGVSGVIVFVSVGGS